MINPHQLSTHLFRELHRHPTVSFIHHCVFIALFSVYLLRELPLETFAVWLGLALFGGIWQWLISTKQSREISETLKPQSLSAYTTASLAAGLSFGMTALLLPELSFETRLFVILMLAAVAASELLKLSAFPNIYAAYLVGLTLPLIIVLVVIDGTPGWELIPALAVMILILYYSAIQRRRDLMDDLMSRFGLENDAGEDKLTQVANRRRYRPGDTDSESPYRGPRRYCVTGYVHQSDAKQRSRIAADSNPDPRQTDRAGPARSEYGFADWSPAGCAPD